MNKQDTIKPVDVYVAVALAVDNRVRGGTYAGIGEVLGLSQSAVHGAVRRLQRSGLLRAGTKSPNRRALRDFLVHGVRYAFPPQTGKTVRGVPTAHAGPPLAKLFDAGTPIVWPDINGDVRGTGLVPLHPNAVNLPARAPDAYGALTLVDAVRVGDARERNAAIDEIDRLLGDGVSGG